MNPLIKNEDIMEGGSKCISIIDMKAEPMIFDIHLATMSIANDCYDNLKLIQETSKISDIEDKIEAKMMKNIRLILGVLHSSPEIFANYSGVGLPAVRKYLFRKKEDSADFASESVESFIESVMKCHRSLFSILYKSNNEFFSSLGVAAKAGNLLMHSDDKDSEHDRIIRENRFRLAMMKDDLPKHSLSTPDDDFRKDWREKLRWVLITMNSE